MSKEYVYELQTNSLFHLMPVTFILVLLLSSATFLIRYEFAGYGVNTTLFMVNVFGSGLACYVTWYCLQQKKRHWAGLSLVGLHLLLLTGNFYILWQPGNLLPFLFVYLIVISSAIIHPQASLYAWVGSLVMMSLSLWLRGDFSTGAMVSSLGLAWFVSFSVALATFLIALEWTKAVTIADSSRLAVRQRRDELFASEQALAQANQLLAGANKQLVATRMALEEANNELENRVAARTAELQASEQRYRLLFKQTKANLQRTEALYTAARALNKFDNLPLILQAIVDGIATALPAYAVSLITLDQIEKQVAHFVKGGTGAAQLDTVSYEELQDGLSGWALRHGQPLLSPKGKPDPREDDAVQKRREQGPMGSILVTPLVYRERVLGTITALNHKEQPDFTEGDLSLLVAMADQATTAIENGRLFSEIQNYSKELEQKNEALSRLDKLKDEFLANTSHELRTPLNGIIGIADSMLEGAVGPLMDEQKHSLSLLATSGRRLFNLVNDLLDFSRLRHHDLELNIKPVDMYSLTNVILMVLSPLAKQKGLQLHNNISPEVTAVACDEDRVQQVMYNLVGNGIKFTQAGQISVTAEPRQDYLAITVSDTGIGIAPANLDQIFESFTQEHGAVDREYRGAGLGLSISRSLIELHGGTITVTSTPGQGSDFTFTLPLTLETKNPIVSQPTIYADTVESDYKAGPTPSTATEQFTIMLVDDEPINLEILKNYLVPEAYAVVPVSDGYTALDMVQSGHAFDLILLDVMMPRLSGYEVCRRLRAKYSAAELPVIMVTARNQLADLLSGFAVGANDYLTKPINKQELLARIRVQLQVSQLNIAYGRFVPHEFLNLLHKESILDVRLGDQIEQEMTVLFADVRDFTGLSETMAPQENFSFINTLLGRMGPLVRQHGGFIDKYMGDSIMALFPQRADDALQAAIAMRQELNLFNQERITADQRPIQMGIGVHSGSLMLGTIGELQRMEGTVISDTVNTGARIESLTKRYQVPTLISSATIAQLETPAQYDYRFIDTVQVKGKQGSVDVYELFNSDGEKQAGKEGKR